MDAEALKCPRCHGEGWAYTWCYTCNVFLHQSSLPAHKDHRRTTGERPCEACGGTGKIVDLVRRRLTGLYTPKD